MHIKKATHQHDVGENFPIHWLSSSSHALLGVFQATGERLKSFIEFYCLEKREET